MRVAAVVVVVCLGAGCAAASSPQVPASGGMSGSAGTTGAAGAEQPVPEPTVDAATGTDQAEERPAPRPDAAVSTSDAGPAPEVTPPTPGLHIIFPPPGAASADTLVVRGTSTLAGTGAIRVNGVAATSGDGFATFRAVVPLAMGDNTLTVTAESQSGGALGQAAVTVRRFADDASIQRGGGDPFSLFRQFGFAVDGEQREAIVGDDIFDGVVRIDLATGNRGLASASESSARGMVGKGYNDIAQPRDVAFDRPGHVVIIDDGKLEGIDLPSGDRTLLSGMGVGTGPAATLYGSVAYDDAGHRALALDIMGNALFAIEVATGNRTILAGATVGAGQKLDGFGSLEVDGARHRALVTRVYTNPIIAIDLVTGDRSTLSGDNAGTGPALVEPTGLAVAPALGVVLAWDKTAKHLVAVELTTGNRRILADATTGGGVALPGLEALSFGRELLYARGGGGLLAIDPVEGHRVFVSR
jgi:hypothetical protein